MSSTTARDPRNDRKRTDEAILEGDAQFIAGLKVFSGDSDSVSGLAGGNAQNSPKAPAGNYLAREGDSMIGPIALGPPVNFRVQIGTEEEINISNLGDSPQYSSNIELDSVQPNGFVLDRIDGAAFDGQILIMRTFGPDSFTISQATLANGGNIQTATDDDFELEALQMIILVFDEALQIFANTGGTWRVLSGAGDGGTSIGTYASAVMDQDQVANLALNDHFQFNDYVENGGIVLQGLTPTFDQTSGIFELKAGKTYSLEADVSGEFNTNADSAEIVWYDRTNAAELGSRGKSNPLSAAGQLTNKHSVNTIITPVTDIDVEVRIVTLVGTINTIFSNSAQANIFEFSGKNGATGPQGPAGAAGSGTNWKIPARAKSTEDVPNLANADVIFDGITLIEDDRVLLTDQTTLSENGLWQVGVVAAGFAPLTRPTDFDENSEVISETFVPIEEGTIYNNQLWHLISNNPLTIDVSNQLWDQFAPGTSGGPDMGGGEDGVDGAGEFVNDGRIAAGSNILKIWEKIEFPANTNPNNRRNNLIYMPAQNSPSLPARILYNALSNNTRGGAYSDDYGVSWTLAASLTSNNGYGRMAYAPNLGTNGTLCIIRVQLGFGSSQFKIQVSTDRGTSFSTTTMPNNGQDFVDLIWVESLGLFVATAAGVNTNPAQAVYTSTDGSTWIARTTPLPTNAFADWHRIVYSPTLGKFYNKNNATGVNDPEFITSVDGITWLGPFVNDNPVGIPKRIIWSEGQQKFAAAGSSQGVFFSDDFITWTDTTPADLDIAADIVWAPDLSLWVVIGSNTLSSFVNPMIWASNDGVNWVTYPNNNFRTVPTSISNERVQIVYGEEFQYFFGMNSGFGTTQQQFYRTGQRR